MSAIRGALDSEGFTDVSIMAYTAKYAVSHDEAVDCEVWTAHWDGLQGG